MRYPASEKLEIIRLVEQSHLPVSTDAGEDRRRTSDILPLVRSLSSWRIGSLGRQAVPTVVRLEPHPR